jgi:hypothetical protein
MHLTSRADQIPYILTQNSTAEENVLCCIISYRCEIRFDAEKRNTQEILNYWSRKDVFPEIFFLRGWELNLHLTVNGDCFKEISKLLCS